MKAAEKVRFSFSGNLNENTEIDLNHTNGYILIKDKEGKKIIPTLGNKATIDLLHNKHLDMIKMLTSIGF